MSDDYDEFDVWTTRPILAHVRDFARARRVGPLPMLGALLVRAIAATGPSVVLPPMVGDVASLNLIVAFIGPSGAGKGSTEAAARRATTLPMVEELPIGSGEGVARTFAPPPLNKDGEPVAERTTRAIFTASEVDTLAAVGSRKGSTLLPTIRSMWSGEALGAANAQAHTRVNVPAHSYRACLTIGVQPEAAGPLLADTRGTAQRIVWLPVGDLDAPDEAPSCPEPYEVRRHLAPADDRLVLELPDVAVKTMRLHRLAVLRREDVDPLDGHKMLTQAKLAAGFMLLDGRLGTVTVKDWELAGWLLCVSDRQRTAIARELDELKRRNRRARAMDAAEHDETVAERRLLRAKEAVLRWLSNDQEAGLASLRRRARSSWRDDVPAAVAELVDAGELVESEAKQGGKRYRLAGSTRPPVHPLASTQVSAHMTGGQEASTGGPLPTPTGGPVYARVDPETCRSDTGGPGGRVDLAKSADPNQLEMFSNADDHAAEPVPVSRFDVPHGPATEYQIPAGSPITAGRHTPIKLSERRGRYRALANYNISGDPDERNRVDVTAPTALEAWQKARARLLDLLSTDQGASA